MRITITILQKVLVNYFYKVNTGFFLFVFYVLFGLPQNVKEFHLSLIYGVIKNPSMLLLVMGAWVLYNIKCTDYIIKQLKQPQQQFLYCLYNLPAAAMYTYFLYVQLMVYLPVLLYAIFVAAIALQKGYTAPAIETILFTAAITSLTPLIYTRVLQHRPFIQGMFKLPRMFAGLQKPLFSLPLYHIWYNRKQMLFITKTFSLLLLYAFIKLYGPEHYDIRPALLCFMLVAAVNSTTIFEMKIFEDYFLQIQRNFAFTIVNRFANTLLTYAILLLPELLFIWKGYPLYFTVFDYLQLLLLSVGLLALFKAVLLTDDMKMDSFMRIVFFILIALFFIILYNPGILLGVVLLSVSFGIYASYYYGFEKKYR